MILETDFLDHWKTRMFVDMIGHEHATHYILRLWFHCQIRKTTTFEGLTPQALKAICHYPGDGLELGSALVACGFAVGLENGGYSVPKWAEMNSKLIANWENGKVGGRPAAPAKPQKQSVKPQEITQRKPNSNPQVTHTEPISKISKTDKNVSSSTDNVFQDLPAEFNSVDFREQWLAWEEYLKAVHHRPMQPMQRGPAFVELLKDCKSAANAMSAIRKAMANGWKSIHALKENELPLPPPAGKSPEQLRHEANLERLAKMNGVEHAK